MQTLRNIIYYKDYFNRFFESQDLKTQRKIEYVMELIRFEKRVPEKYLKHFKGTEGIYEIRIRTMKGSLRILSFFDNGSLIVLINCFVKKSKKVPVKEIKLAEKLKHEYFILKLNN